MKHSHHWGTGAILGLVLCASLVPLFAKASVDESSDLKGCVPVTTTKCGCDQVLNQQGQCVNGNNRYMCFCSQTDAGKVTSGMCDASQDCVANSTGGKDVQKAPETPQAAATNGNATAPSTESPGSSAGTPQLSGASTPSTGSETGAPAATGGSADAPAPNTSVAQSALSDMQSLLGGPSPQSPQSVGGEPNGAAPEPAASGPDLSPELSTQQADLQPSESPPLSTSGSSGSGPTGQATAAFGPDGSFTQIASQPMGSLEGLTNAQAQEANFNAEPTDQQNAENTQALQNAADNGSGAAQAALEYQSSTNPDAASQPQDETTMRATFYTPGSGGAINGGVYGTHDNYLDPSTPTVAAGPSSGLNYGDVVNVTNPATGQSVNAVVGDACPGCGSGIDLTPVAANAVGLSVEQGTAPMQVGLMGETGSYAAGAQLAASLNGPSDPWSAAPTSFSASTAQASPSLASAPASVEDFPGYESAQVYADSTPLPSSSAFADTNVPLPQANPYGQSVFNNGSSDSYAAAQPYQTASDLPAVQAPTIEESPVTSLEPVPVTPVETASLPPSAEQLQAQASDEVNSYPTEQGPAVPTEAVTSEPLQPAIDWNAIATGYEGNLAESAAENPSEEPAQEEPSPTAEVDSQALEPIGPGAGEAIPTTPVASETLEPIGPGAGEPNPTTPVESQPLEAIGPNAEQPYPAVAVDSQATEPIGPGAGEAYPTEPVESASLPPSVEQLQAQASDEVNSYPTEQGPANPTEPVTSEPLQALEQLTPQERIDDVFNTLLQPTNSAEPAFNDPYSIPAGLSGGTSPGDLAFAGPTAGAPGLESSQLPSWANTVVSDMQGAQAAVQNDYQALASEFGASNSQTASESSETPTSGEAPQENAQPIENPPLPTARPSLPSNPSIVDYLNSVGQDASFAARQTIAASLGIANYVGSAAQNLQLLSSCFTKGCNL